MSVAEDGIASRFSSEQASAAARDFDLKRLPADFIDDPFPYYRALREHDPVHRMPDGAYLITRWRDCDTVYRDARVFSSDKKVEFRPKYGDAPLFEHHTTSLVFNDPPLHTHVRRAIQMALSNRVIAEMEAGLVALVDRLLDAMAREGPRRPDRGFRRRHSGRDHRQPARRAACGPRSAARLVARDPGRARAGADRASRWRSATTSVRDFAAYLKGLVDDRRRTRAIPRRTC